MKSSSAVELSLARSQRIFSENLPSMHWLKKRKCNSSMKPNGENSCSLPPPQKSEVRRFLWYEWIFSRFGFEQSGVCVWMKMILLDHRAENASDVANERKKEQRTKRKFIQISHYSALEFPYQMFATRRSLSEIQPDFSHPELDHAGRTLRNYVQQTFLPQVFQYFRENFSSSELASLHRNGNIVEPDRSTDRKSIPLSGRNV